MKKSRIPEFLIWVPYALASGACLLMTAMAFSQGRGFGVVPGVVGAVLVAVLLGLLVKGIHRLAQNEELKKFFFDKQFLYIVAEGVAFIAILVGMIALRSEVSWEVAGNPVYEAAQVTNGNFQVVQAHGGYKVYLYLMNIALALLGNRTFAAVMLQLILLLGAAASLYFGIRKIAGVGAALLTTAFLGFAPYMLAESCSLTPFLLFLLCFGLALNCIGSISDSISSTGHVIDQIVAVLCYVASGVLIGFCCYLDVAGIVLLVILTGAICFGDDKRLRNDLYNNYTNRFSEILASPVVVFVSIVLVAVFSYWRMHGSFASLLSQIALYTPGNFRVPIALEAGGTYWEGILIAALFMFGVFSFWCSKKMGNRVIWLFVTILLAAMQCFGISSPEYFNGSAVLYMLCVILAGCGFADVLAEAPEGTEKVEEAQMAIIDMDAPREPVADAGNSAIAEPAINYIENPLPLPRKHTKKVMDYDYEVADDDDFDIQ